MKVKKAIIPVAGLGSRFLPLSKSVPKEFWPLIDKPVIQYVVEEAKASGIKDIVFVSKPGREMAFDYFNTKLNSKKVSFARYKSHFQKDLENLENFRKIISFHQAYQKEPLGAAHAVLQAEKFVGKEPCAILWADDVVESKKPCLLQLMEVFEKYKKSVIAIYKIPEENFHFYGMIKGKKINAKTYSIEDFIEKPKTEESPSDLAIVGKYIITPDVFDYMKKINFDLKSDLSLSTVLVDMAKRGEKLYGHRFDGKWLECGNKLAYLKSNFYLSLKNPDFGKELKYFLKKNV